MKRFQFRFKTILRVRENSRDEAQRRVAEAQQAYDLLAERLEKMRTDQKRVRSERSQQLIGSLSVAGLLDHGRYDLQVEAEVRELSGQMKQIFEEIERRRQRLSLAEQEYRKFLKLEELAQERFEQQQLQIRQHELDEIASQRGRSRRGHDPAEHDQS
jgi:flagellar FliJ protein